jgi:hypothetical protein
MSFKKANRVVGRVHSPVSGVSVVARGHTVCALEPKRIIDALMPAIMNVMVLLDSACSFSSFSEHSSYNKMFIFEAWLLSLSSFRLVIRLLSLFAVFVVAIEGRPLLLCNLWPLPQCPRH